jgi:hypothetical protein
LLSCRPDNPYIADACARDANVIVIRRPANGLVDGRWSLPPRVVVISAIGRTADSEATKNAHGLAKAVDVG